MEALGDATRHWKSVKHRKGYHDRHDRVAHQAVTWLVSLARQEGAHKTLRKLRQHQEAISLTLNLAGRDFHSALRDPAKHVAQWKQALASHKNRSQLRSLRQWRAKLFTHRAAPTCHLYRWLRKQPPPVHLVMQNQEGLSVGPQEFFEQARGFWSNIWQSDPCGHREAVQMLPNLIDEQVPPHP